MSLEPWPNGCGGCGGVCCFGCAFGLAPRSDDERDNLAEQLGTDAANELQAWNAKVDTDDWRCNNLTAEGLCGIEVKHGYAAKPFTCQADEVGSRICLEAREHAGLSITSVEQ